MPASRKNLTMTRPAAGALTFSLNIGGNELRTQPSPPFSFMANCREWRSVDAGCCVAVSELALITRSG